MADEDTVGSVKAKLDENPRVSLREVSDSLNLSYGTVNRVVTDKLQMRRINARWVTRMLTTDQKELSIRASENCLRR